MKHAENESSREWQSTRGMLITEALLCPLNFCTAIISVNGCRNEPNGGTHDLRGIEIAGDILNHVTEEILNTSSAAGERKAVSAYDPMAIRIGCTPCWQ